jgi:hypothetical protein
VIGSYGTPAAGSVVEAQNNLFYINKYAVNTTGAKPDMLNVLSTDEVSLAIRPNVQAIGADVLDKVQAIFFRGKILFAVPYNNSENSEIWVLDLELKTWVRPWTLPVKKFLVYTDDSGVERLLYRPSGAAEDQSCLVEISDDFQHDNGKPFAVEFMSPVIQFDASHFQFERVQKVYFEFLKALGVIDVQIYGSMKNRDIQLLRNFQISTSFSYAGFDNELFDQSLFDQAGGLVKVFKNSYTKKVMKVRKTLNNISVKISTTSASDWMLSVISIVGIPKKVNDPSRWKK